MESKVETKVAEEQKPSSLNTNPPGPMVTQPETSPEESWQDTLEPMVEFLKQFPDEGSKLFLAYKQPLLYVMLMILAIIAVYLTLAVLEAINRIPLCEPLFELVGIGYSCWFVVRYLIKEPNRKELKAELNDLKTVIIGKIEDTYDKQ